MGTCSSQPQEEKEGDSIPFALHGNARFIKPSNRRTNHPMPQILIERMALFLPDATTFFHFLLAFSSPTDGDVLGDLHILLDLGRQLPLEDLWPRIQLHPLNMHLVVPHLSVISKYYAVIEIHDCREIANDTSLHRLATLPFSNIATSFHLVNSSTTWWPASWNQHITSVDMTTSSNPALVHVLSSMSHLTDLTLHACFQEEHLDAIFSWLSTSKITSLAIFAPLAIVLTESMAKSIVQWLETRCVRRLACADLDFSHVPHWEARFHAAMVSCTSLQLSELALERMASSCVATAVVAHVEHLELNLHDADPSMLGPWIDGCQNLRSLTVRDATHRSWVWGARLHEIISKAPALEKVELRGVALDQASMDSFGAALAASHVSSFTMRPYDGVYEGWVSYELDMSLDRLGPWLPRWTRLRRLELSCATRYSKQLDALGDGLVQSSVTNFIALSVSIEFLLAMGPYFERSKLQHLTITNLQSTQKMHRGPPIHGMSLESKLDQTARRSLFHNIFGNCHLKSLNLQQLSMRDDAAKDLAHALRRNDSISRLNVSKNEITINGVHAIVQAIQGRPCPCSELNVSHQLGQTKWANVDAQTLMGAEIYCTTVYGM
ncbi:Aste57867_4044 [Aphanomyces stellatus]|uniref:Aste57867_4044 protein n=1 Tax=Aphanomyces stellatus TaxID=120398 RepID=A0A485KCH0_9STRA|nr:hypothetical protein As57867_004033 [Aphanomyces stellatus]VFT81179.1 Aste57867_4044 [Aphanomyces stellatus]